MTEREIFDAALDIRDDESRADYLRQACGSDARLRDHLEGLLRIRRQVGDFLESRAPIAVSSLAVATADP